MKTWRGSVVVAYKTSPLRILLIQNIVSGKITCPGGAVENGENNITAATRELKEEVGWKIDPKDLVATDIKHEFTYGPNKPERSGDSASNEIFLLNADRLPDPVETDNTNGVTWYEINEGPKRISFKDVSPLIKRALKQIE